MSSINSKKAKLSLSLCIISMLLAPTFAKADTGIVLAAAETGSIAARQAADQKAALAKKAAERAAKKAAEAQTPPAVQTAPAAPAQEPATTPTPAEEQK